MSETAQILKNSAISGSIWKITDRITTQAIGFVIGVVLARLLSPDDYGLMGMLSIFFSVASTFQDSGFGSALIQKKNKTEDDYSTVFIFNITASVIIYVLFFVAAPYIADFYQVPLLEDVVRISSISFITGGLSNIFYTKLNIDLRFKLIAKLSITGTIITGVTGISLAYLGYGIWALVVQNLSCSILVGLLLWFVVGWRPSFRFSKKSFSSLFKFGSNVLLSNMINAIYGNLYTLVIGKAYNPTEVGMYNRANGYASMPSDFCSSVTLQVNYPILAKLQDNDELLLKAYEKLLKIPFFFLYPLMIGLIVCIEPLISIMIGDKWLPCVPYLQILCVGYMFYPLNGFNMNLLLVKGRSDLVLRMDLIKKPIGIILLIVAIPFGIIWMMVGKAAYSIIVFSINCYYTKRILDYGILRQVKILTPITLNAIIMGVAIYVTTFFIQSNVLKLAIGIPEGILIYLSISYLLRNEAFFEIIGIIQSKISRK